MRKYVFRKGLVLGIIVLFVGASVIPCISGNDIESSSTSKNSIYKKVNAKDDRDQIDQSQLVIENNGQIIRDNIWGAQSITPIYQIQTRLFVAICKIGTPPNDITISIRDSLSGPDLTSFSIPKDQIPAYPGILWNEANYDDVEVIPQQTYYIVAKTTGGDTSNYYLWFGCTGNPYPGGALWWSEDYGYYWGVNWDMDLCFETYGRDNLPPNAPTITGPTSGKPNQQYTFTFNALDLDGDDVKYYIDWGDGDNFTTNFAPSGSDVDVSHTWTDIGTYTVEVYAEDKFGAVGGVTTGQFIVEKSKTINKPFLNFLQSHLYMFPVIQQILQRLGLI